MVRDDLHFRKLWRKINQQPAYDRHAGSRSALMANSRNYPVNMPILTPSNALIIGFIVTPGLFLLSAYFTHATRRHMLGALVGALLYASVNYSWDRIAAAFGWWKYPAWSATGQFPLTGYVLAGFVGGGAFGMVGWSMIKRWHWIGYAGFLSFWAFYALIHDIGGSRLFASSSLMVFAPGPIPIIADMFWYVTGNALPPLLVWLIGDSPIKTQSTWRL